MLVTFPIEDTVIEVLLCLCDGDSSGTQEEECPLLEAGTLGLEGQQANRARCVLQFKL
jgi:hypothetical protein